MDGTQCGGPGDDSLHGVAGDDALHGGAGDDTLHRGAGDDILHGVDGDDTLHEVDGDDTQSGVAGDDTHGKVGMGAGEDGGETRTPADAAKADCVREEGEADCWLLWGHPEHITWSAVMVMEEGVLTGDNLCGMRQLS